MTGMRERERYGRKSLAERVSDAWAWFRGNRNAQIVVGLIAAGLALLFVLTPSTVRFDQLAEGDCLFVRTRSAVDLDRSTSIGDPSAIAAILLADGAERTACDQNHGHEVIAVGTLDGAPGDPYPGSGPLRAAEEVRCEAAFEPYVGRPADGSAFVAFVVVPDDIRWDAGSRTVACLLQRADGRYLDRPARGSGE